MTFVQSSLAVQDERQKSGMSGEGESPSSPAASNGSASNPMNMGSGSSVSVNDDEMLIDKLIAAELSVEPKIHAYHEEECSHDRLLSTTNSQLAQLIDWAKRVPNFATLCVEDQCALIRASWRDILCCSLAYRSVMAPDCGLILPVSRSTLRHERNSIDDRKSVSYGEDRFRCTPIFSGIRFTPAL